MIKRKTAARMLLAAVSAGIPVLIWMLLPVRGQPTDIPDYSSVHGFAPTREGGHLTPNVDQLMRGEYIGQTVRFITNSKGFRSDREFSYEVPEGTFRILFLGDSFVDGMRTDQKDTIGYLLEKCLDNVPKKDGYTDCEVLISGHNNCANAWYYYQQYGHRYNPSLVIMGVTFGNDLTWHNYNVGMVPERDADGRVSLSYTGNPDHSANHHSDVFLPREAFKGLGPIRTFGRKVEFRIRYIFARRLALFGYARPPRIVPGPRSPGNVNTVGNSTAIGLFYQPQIPEITQMFTDFEAVISGLHSRVTEDDADFLAVFFPVRIQVSKRDWELLRRAYALDPSAFDLDYPNTRLGSFCRDRGIPFVDLLPSMKAVTETEGVSVFRRLGDMHLNERGQQISATAICDELIPNLGK